MIRTRRIVWGDARMRAVAWQVVVVAVVCAIVALVAIQAVANLRQRGLVSGFGYLTRAAEFDIAAGPLPFSPHDTYARALVVGLVNTLRVAALGIIIATGFGIAIGVARLSTIWLVSATARAYVEIMRNTPLLLQLLFWYSLSQSLPEPRAALNPVPGVFLCFRGLFLPRLAWHDGPGLAYPALAGFGFEGGTSISPEFAALLIGLSTYAAAFIGEIVRGGVLSVGKGQMEAAAALGLSRGQALRLVVLPQALPVVLPPMTSQYLNIAKGSSLAVAIGYPDLIAITTTTLNQTGQAIEAIAVAMVAYVAISLLISAAMNLYGHTATRTDGGLQA